MRILSEKKEIEHMNSYKYFENRDCKYYPCHDTEHVNCLFCYCPLYQYDNCPGSYKIITTNDNKTVKSCIDCEFPHKSENYEKIIAILNAKIK